MRKEKNQKKQKTGRRQILVSILQEWLTPVGVTVQHSIPILVQSPESDILLIRREGKEWTKEQMERLPDGIRDSQASHILVEFKAAEAINPTDVQQIEEDDQHYLESRKLKRKELQSFLVSSKTISSKSLKTLQFETTQIKGVYCGVSVYNENTTLLVVNQLDDVPHNASIKLFASRAEEREKALGHFENTLYGRASSMLESSIAGLWKLLSTKGYQIGQQSVTVEEVERLGQNLVLGQLRADEIPVKEMIKEIGLKNIIEKVGTDKVIKAFGVEKLEARLEELKAKKED